MGLHVLCVHDVCTCMSQRVYVCVRAFVSACIVWIGTLMLIFNFALSCETPRPIHMHTFAFNYLYIGYE